MWVKICGNTDLEDAQLAAELGADAVGFVFAASKRQVTAAQVAAIVPHLPPHVERVGVFDSHTAGEIAAVALASGLTAVQLHGGLDDDLATRLAQRFAGSVRIVPTLHCSVAPLPLDAHPPQRASIGTQESSAAQLALQLAVQIERIASLGATDRILIDSKVGAVMGGTGVPFDWASARAAFASAPSNVHLILAGGLTPRNVALAIAQLKPWGVDVSSGVESSPGRKDPALLARFIRNARAVDAS